MKCKEKKCGGKVEVNPDKAVSLQTGCSGCGTPRTDAYPCNKCGSLHYDDGSSVETRAGANVFLKDGEVVKKTVNPNAPIRRTNKHRATISIEVIGEDSTQVGSFFID